MGDVSRFTSFTFVLMESFCSKDGRSPQIMVCKIGMNTGDRKVRPMLPDVLNEALFPRCFCWTQRSELRMSLSLAFSSSCIAQ